LAGKLSIILLFCASEQSVPNYCLQALRRAVKISKVPCDRVAMVRVEMRLAAHFRSANIDHGLSKTFG